MIKIKLAVSLVKWVVKGSFNNVYQIFKKKYNIQIGNSLMAYHSIKIKLHSLWLYEHLIVTKVLNINM